MSRGRFGWGVRILCLGASLWLAGCVAQTEPLGQPVEPPPAFSQPGEAGRTDVPARWWTVFADEALDAAVERALTDNFDLLTAWERLQAAEAVADRTSAALWPELEGSARGEAMPVGSGDETPSALDLGLTARYEVDLWGRLRSRVEAERFRREATRADYQAAALSLTAEIVRTWYAVAEAQAQLALVERQVETNETVLELLRNRFEAGQIRGVDVVRQQRLLEATEEQRMVVEARRAVLAHRLAMLLGAPPQRAEALPEPPAFLPALPPLPATGVPVDLVRRRPDVRSAFLRLEAADRELASAISAKYPRLSLSATASTAATTGSSARSLFDDWATTVVGNLLVPIFYGGELRAEVDRAEAVRRERLYAYGQATLVAFQEVEDALVQEARQRDRLASLERQVALADRAYERLRVQYFNGATDYLNVLTALEEVQQLRRDLVAAELTLLEFRVALYRALAGAFETPREAAADPG